MKTTANFDLRDREPRGVERSSKPPLPSVEQDLKDGNTDWATFAAPDALNSLWPLQAKSVQGLGRRVGVALWSIKQISDIVPVDKPVNRLRRRLASPGRSEVEASRACRPVCK